jgi:hypothetical protein
MMLLYKVSYSETGVAYRKCSNRYREREVPPPYISPEKRHDSREAAEDSRKQGIHVTNHHPSLDVPLMQFAGAGDML